MLRSLLRFVILFALVTAFSVTSASAKKPLKIFILAGQSNMEGHAHIRVLDYLGEDPETAPLLKKIKNDDGQFREIPQTWITLLTGNPLKEFHGPLMAGYGSRSARDTKPLGEKIGPELAFGVTMQQHYQQPILIIKTAWGGQSLNIDFRSPSSGAYERPEGGRELTEEQQAAIRERTGRRYRQMVEHVRKVLQNPQRVCPAYDPDAGYELAGFVWFQGWNDMVDRGTYPQRDQPGGYNNYSKWMANFIRDVRADLDSPKLPFVIGVMGVNGKLDKSSRYYNVHSNFRQAMAAPAKLPEFQGNVVAVQTAPFWDERLQAIDDKRQEVRAKANALKRKAKGHENEDGQMSEAESREFMAAYEKKRISEEDLALEKRARSNAAYHYLGSAKTLSLIGQAFAESLIELNR